MDTKESKIDMKMRADEQLSSERAWGVKVKSRGYGVWAGQGMELGGSVGTVYSTSASL